MSDHVQLTRRPVRRRAKGDGTLYKRADGRWGGSLTLPDGRRKTVYGRTMAEAKERLRDLIRRQEQGLLVAGADQKVRDYLQGWLEDSARPSVRVSTYQAYFYLVKGLVPVIGHIRLGELTPAQVQAAYTELHRRGWSPTTVQHAHRVLHRAMRQAVFWGLILRNPTDGAARPRVRRQEMKILNEEQVRQLLATSKGDRDHALWLLLVTTGLRLGEALGLKWEDVSLEQGRLYVRRALQRQPRVGLVFVEPKSDRSRRHLHLPAGTTEALVDHRREQTRQRLLLGPEWTDSDLVFCSTVGRPRDRGEIGQRFHAALAKAGLPEIRVHDLRHTAASLLLAQGVHPKVVQEMLGHSSISLTLDTYSHVTPGLQEAAATRLQELLFR